LAKSYPCEHKKSNHLDRFAVAHLKPGTAMYQALGVWWIACLLRPSLMLCATLDAHWYSLPAFAMDRLTAANASAGNLAFQILDPKGIDQLEAFMDERRPGWVCLDDGPQQLVVGNLKSMRECVVGPTFGGRMFFAA
jgi:hypothetical protein